MGAYIKENWLFVVVAVYLVSMVLYGHYRGFIRLAVSAVSLVLSLGVVHFGAPSVANLLRSNEVVYQAVEDSVTKFIQKDDEAENEAADAAPPSVQRSIIEEMELPEQLKDALLENNNSEVYEALGVSSFTHYVSRYLANSQILLSIWFRKSSPIAVAENSVISSAAIQTKKIPSAPPSTAPARRFSPDMIGSRETTLSDTDRTRSPPNTAANSRKKLIILIRLFAR